MSPFGKWRTISPVCIVIVEQAPVVTSPSSESEKILSKNVGGASINLGSGFFSSWGVYSTTAGAPGFLPPLAAAAAAYLTVSSLAAISSAVGGGGATSISFLWLRLTSTVSTNNLLSLS